MSLLHISFDVANNGVADCFAHLADLNRVYGYPLSDDPLDQTFFDPIYNVAKTKIAIDISSPLELASNPGTFKTPTELRTILPLSNRVPKPVTGTDFQWDSSDPLWCVQRTAP